jgi:hypothetical protein
MGFHEIMLAEIRKVLGNLHLRRPQNLLKVTHAKGPLRKQMQDAQAGFVAEAFVDLDEAHETTYTI